MRRASTEKLEAENSYCRASSCSRCPPPAVYTYHCVNCKLYNSPNARWFQTQNPIVAQIHSFVQAKVMSIPSKESKNSPVWDGRCGYLGSVGGEDAVVLAVQVVVVVAGGRPAGRAAGSQGLLGLALAAAVSGHVCFVELEK